MKPRRPWRASTLLSPFTSDKAGVAAIEFALIAPVLIVMYLGLVDITLGVSFKQRLNHATSAVNDIVGQSATLTQNEIKEIFTAGEAIMHVDLSDRMTTRTSQIQISTLGVAKVVWSVGRNRTAYAPGEKFPVSKSIVSSPGDYLIATEIVYTYSPVTTYWIADRIPIEGVIYSRPRGRKGVKCSDCPVAAK